MTNTEEYRERREKYLASKETPAPKAVNKKKVASKIPRNTPAQKKANLAKWAKNSPKWDSSYNAYTGRNRSSNEYVGK
jgi:hypothetical protein